MQQRLCGAGSPGRASPRDEMDDYTLQSWQRPFATGCVTLPVRISHFLLQDSDSDSSMSRLRPLRGDPTSVQHPPVPRSPNPCPVRTAERTEGRMLAWRRRGSTHRDGQKAENPNLKDFSALKHPPPTALLCTSLVGARCRWEQG